MKIIVFKVGNEDYGVTIDSVKEVVPTPKKVAKLPLSPPYIKGICNIRGNLIKLLSLEDKFGISTDTEMNYTLVLSDINIGILTKEVPYTLSVNEVHPYDYGNVNYIDGVINQNNKMIILINKNKLFNIL